MAGENGSKYLSPFPNTAPRSSNSLRWSLGLSARLPQNFWLSSSAMVVRGSSLNSVSLISSILWVWLRYRLSVTYSSVGDSRRCSVIKFLKSIYSSCFCSLVNKRSAFTRSTILCKDSKGCALYFRKRVNILLQQK